ncbi:MAG: hypothetical protein JJ895_00805 [Balneolaceae bacterium]|nr:hypothetical protein [Balneolaceae bacterium]
MRLIFRSNSLFASILILALTVGCAPKNTSPEKLTPDQLVANYYEAVGGYDAIKAIETLQIRGYYIEPAYDFLIPASILKKRPNYRLIGDIERVGFEEGFNGTAWEYHSDRGLILREGEAKEAILVGAEFDHPFIDAKEKGNELLIIGSRFIGGRNTIELEVTMQVMENPYVASYYFDEDNFLLVAQRKVMPIHAVGPDVEIINLYSDFRPVNGVLFPFASIERNENTFEFLNATIWNEIIANEEIPMETFDPPGD